MDAIIGPALKILGSFLAVLMFLFVMWITALLFVPASHSVGFVPGAFLGIKFLVTQLVAGFKLL